MFLFTEKGTEAGERGPVQGRPESACSMCFYKDLAQSGTCRPSAQRLWAAMLGLELPPRGPQSLWVRPLPSPSLVPAWPSGIKVFLPHTADGSPWNSHRSLPQSVAQIGAGLRPGCGQGLVSEKSRPRGSAASQGQSRVGVSALGLACWSPRPPLSLSGPRAARDHSGCEPALVGLWWKRSRMMDKGPCWAATHQAVPGPLF